MMNKRITSTYGYLALFFVIVLSLVLLPKETRADHVDDPCLAVPGNLATVDPFNPGNGDAGGRSGEVPVYDNDTNRNLVRVINTLNSIGTLAQQGEYQAEQAQQYLRLLCEKEFDLDHRLQHEWREVIGEFVSKAWNWTISAYSGNPIFVTNQHLYYQLVDDEVLLTFLIEIAESNIDDLAKREIIQTYLRQRFNSRFPYDVAGTGETMANQNVAASLNQQFIEYGGVETLNLLSQPGNSYLSTLELAEAELNKRRAIQSRFEDQKLDWGRGFFSYENCDSGDGNRNMTGELGVYSDIPEDRRNCGIVTPGALIQDQVTNVFGSALRQMELADEYEEWISNTSFAAVNAIFSNIGLYSGWGNQYLLANDGNRVFNGTPTNSNNNEVIGPERAIEFINDRAPGSGDWYGGNLQIAPIEEPAEFDLFLGAPGLSVDRTFIDDRFEDRINQLAVPELNDALNALGP